MRACIIAAAAAALFVVPSYAFSQKIPRVEVPKIEPKFEVPEIKENPDIQVPPTVKHEHPKDHHLHNPCDENSGNTICNVENARERARREIEKRALEQARREVEQARGSK
jgi:hypothetical protein